MLPPVMLRAMLSPIFHKIKI